MNTPDAMLNALVEERMAREADYEDWLRRKVGEAVEAAERKEFASDEEVKAVLQRWP